MDLESKLEGLNLSQDEVTRLTEALKKEEFRKLLAEYAEEISDPVNRQRYEDEIAQMERDRGMDVQFVHPDPGYVIKTSNGSKKLFINVCKNENIEQPKCAKKIGPSGKPGAQWSIPHSFAPAREDSDKTGTKCDVVDFVVHPDTYRMAESNAAFKKMLHDTALEGIEKQFEMKPDKKNLKFPKMQFKGTPTATVIRSKTDDVKKAQLDPHDPLSRVKYPYSDKSTKELSEEREKKIEAKQTKMNGQIDSSEGDYQIPMYHILHRGFFDIQDFRDAPDARNTTRPKELVVEIQLPLLKSAASVSLDVLEKSVTLISETPAKYKLELSLPYPVDEEKGNAKFDKGSKKLIITLPVLPAKVPEVSFLDDKNDDIDLKLPSQNPTEKPLIEVLSSEESSNEKDEETVCESSHVSNDGLELDGSASIDTSNGNCTESQKQPEKFYTLPQYDYLQDDETVTVIFDIKNAKRDSIEKTFLYFNDKCVGLKFTVISVGSGGFPMDYRCVVKFPEDCIIEEANSYLDVGEHNVVVTFIKKDACIGHWEKLEVGQSEESTDERFFLSEKALQDELDKLDKELADRQPVNRDEMPDLEVADMDKDHLTVNIKDKKGMRRSVSESGEEIEVVHEKEGPKTRSILKNRSVSESSDDLSGSAYSRQYSSSGSPISESDENGESCSADESGRKKSVSFDERIQSTTFKGSQSVSTMRQQLKNKRKKARKQEKQKGRRRRTTNSFSEQSSDDINEEETPKVLESGDAKESNSEATSKDAPKEESKIAMPEKSDKAETVSKANGGGEAVQSSQDKIGSNCKGTKTKKSDSKSETSKAAANKAKVHINGDIASKARDPAENARVNGDSQENGDENERTKTEYDSDDYNDGEEAANEISESGNSDGPSYVKDPDAPETILNWQENSVIPDEMKPKCAVPLSNNIMFDLDVD